MATKGRPQDAADKEGGKLGRKRRQLDLSKYRQRDGRRDPVVRELERRTRFRIPESLRIVGRTVRICVLRYDLDDLSEIPMSMTIEEGTADFSEGTITVRLLYLKDGKCLMSMDNLAVTLLHEVLHWLHECAGYGDMPNEERFTKQTSELLYQIMPQVVK